MSKAIKGDYLIPNWLSTIGTEEIKKYIFVNNIEHYELYKLVVENCDYRFDYILGYYASNNKFKKVAKIYFNKIGEYYEVDTIYVSLDLRGNNIATKLYTYFAKNLKYTILSSDMQRFGARKLWSKLSRISDLTVDILDINKNEIIEKDTIIYHGDLDEEFDKRVWSYDNDKKHIRLILKDKGYLNEYF